MFWFFCVLIIDLGSFSIVIIFLRNELTGRAGLGPFNLMSRRVGFGQNFRPVYRAGPGLGTYKVHKYHASARPDP